MIPWSLEKIKNIYDKAALFPQMLYLDAFFGGVSSNSMLRKNAVKLLRLKKDDKVLDVACGIGFNFNLIRKHLGKEGLLIGLDISRKSLEFANAIIHKKGWKNVNLINKDILKYAPDFHFDAIISTCALEIVPNPEKTIDKIYSLLKNNGNFSMIGMKTSDVMPFKLINKQYEKFSELVGIDYHRNIKKYIYSKFQKINYDSEFYFGFYYILSAKKISD
ncbi:MAG: class I SAM-dependent methyltransferase [Promethearchaeota archaeon]